MFKYILIALLPFAAFAKNPGAKKACPEDKLTYIDRHEGGPGWVCSVEKKRRNIKVSDAVIQICHEHIVGCRGTTISLHGKVYRVAAANSEVQSQLDGVIGTLRFHHQTSTRPFKATGYFKRVDARHGAENFAVFYLTGGLGSIPLPK